MSVPPGRRLKEHDAIPKNVRQPLRMRRRNVVIEDRQVPADGTFAQERHEGEVAPIAERCRVVVLRDSADRSHVSAVRAGDTTRRPEGKSAHTEMVFPGVLVRMPRLNSSLGVNPWFANEAPCSVTGPVAFVIPTASTTGPAMDSQSET